MQVLSLALFPLLHGIVCDLPWPSQHAITVPWPPQHAITCDSCRAQGFRLWVHDTVTQKLRLRVMLQQEAGREAQARACIRDF